MKKKETLFDILLKVSDLRMDIETAEKRILRLLRVVERSEQLRAFKEFLQSEYHLPVSNRMIDEFKQKQSS
jgi:hypothetical protein